jgi:phytoene dehydrogenase-like protein
MEGWEYGPATFKVDFALSDPVPWKAPEVARTATVHLGNTFEEIAAGEGAAWEGRLDPRPFVLATQPSLFDDTRAPAGRHTLWAYCHVPQGFDGDATDAIEGQIERFAPGFRKTILAKHTMGPADFERYNPNNVGGSIAGGAVTLGQLFARPFPTPWPYTTGIDDVYLCSSSTSPGAGAHGMCGYHAARTALRTSYR